MAQLGADDVAVDNLATTFDRTASGLVTSEQTITALVRSVAWTGPDADVFRGKWDRGMRSQMTDVSDRLRNMAGELRKQAAAQRSTSDGGDVLVTGPPVNPTVEQQAQARIDAVRDAADRWAEQTGRMQIRDMSERSDEAQREWWSGLTPAQRAALMRNDPGALFGLDGLPADVRAEARTAYLDSVRGDIEISSHEDKLAGELNIAWIHLGVEGTAAIVALADGTYRVDLALDGEIGAKLGQGHEGGGAEGEVGVGAGVSQSYTFESQQEAEAFVDGLYEKLTPDVDLSFLAGPGAVMADTVDDVVDYLGDHSAQRTAFEGEIKLQASVDLELGSFDVNVSGEAGARYDFDSHETTVFLKNSFEGELKLPDPPEGTTGNYRLSADLEAAVKFDEHGQISELELKGTVGGEANLGLEQFLNGTTPKSPNPQSVQLTGGSGAQVTFDATLDLQDPIVQQRAAALLNGMGGPNGVSMDDLQNLLRESELQVQIDSTSVASDKWDIGIASLEVSHTDTSNLATWIKPPGGDFTFVSPGELTGGGSQ
jgi:hypothetical protein